MPAHVLLIITSSGINAPIEEYSVVKRGRHGVPELLSHTRANAKKLPSGFAIPCRSVTQIFL